MGKGKGKGQGGEGRSDKGKLTDNIPVCTNLGIVVLVRQSGPVGIANLMVDRNIRPCSISAELIGQDVEIVDGYPLSLEIALFRPALDAFLAVEAGVPFIEVVLLGAASERLERGERVLWDRLALERALIEFLDPLHLVSRDWFGCEDGSGVNGQGQQ